MGDLGQEHRVTRRSVFVTTTFVGFHSWADAPPARGYLKTHHRHRFHVRVELSVLHDDREVEYHDLLDAVERAILTLGPRRPIINTTELAGQSCEHMAVRVAQHVLDKWPNRTVSVEVGEDGENGSRVELSDPF